MKTIWTFTAMALACTIPAGAQTVSERSYALEEITVTAQRREESLQSTPISIAAFSSDMIEERQLFSINEIAGQAPNLQYSSGASGLSGSSNFFIRGIGQDDFITTTEPGVGTYLDGVYLARVTGAALDLADVERVEVLRGPQGTLFGRNTIGGAINVVTARPSGELGGKALGRVGTQGRMEGQFRIDFPLVEDVLFGKLSFLGRSTEGWGRNNWPGADQEELGRTSQVAGRAQLRWLASDALTFDASADYSRHRGTGMPHGMVHFTPTAASAAYNQSAGIPLDARWLAEHPDDIQVNTPMRDELEVFGASLTTTYDFGPAELKLISSYREQNGSSGQDYDGTPSRYLDQLIDMEQWQFSQEAQMSGRALDDRLEWLFGLYYFTEEGQFDTDLDIERTPVQIYTGNKTKSFAAFGQVTYDITDRLGATVGARWTREKKHLDAAAVFGGFDLVPPAQLDDTFKATSPKFGLDYQVSNDLLLYTSVTWGYRSGGFNGRPLSPTDLTSFDPEKAISYEAGFKADLLERRLRLNAAAFYTDYTDIQLTASSTNDQGQAIVSVGNAAKAKVKGFEAELQARPLEGLDLFAGVGYLDTEVTENPGFSFGSTILPNSPEWTLNLGGSYTAALGDFGELTLGGDYSYRSGFFPQFANTAPSYIEGYGLVNARASLRPLDGPWELTVYGKNLTDKIYRTYGQTAGTGDTTIAWFGQTRELGAELSLRF